MGQPQNTHPLTSSRIAKWSEKLESGAGHRKAKQGKKNGPSCPIRPYQNSMDLAIWRRGSGEMMLGYQFVYLFISHHTVPFLMRFCFENTRAKKYLNSNPVVTADLTADQCFFLVFEKTSTKKNGRFAAEKNFKKNLQKKTKNTSK